MKLYVASSWRNKHQQNVVAALRAAHHDVYDFRNPVPGNTGFAWREAGGFNPESFTAAEYQAVLQHPVAVEGYNYDMDAMKACDACVLVLPAGRSASFELGWCTGAGKAGVVILPPDGERFEPELMYREAKIVDSIEYAIAVLDRTYVCTGESATWCPICGDCKCVVNEIGERSFGDAGCPLHELSSKHGNVRTL